MRYRTEERAANFMKAPPCTAESCSIAEMRGIDVMTSIQPVLEYRYCVFVVGMPISS